MNWQDNSGDVKYHLGTNYTREFPNGKKLTIEILANPEDPRAVHVNNGFDPQSGLHGFDINIALGDLIAAARTQSANYSN